MNEHTTLNEARVWLRARLTEGVACPCCTQRAQMYRRALNSGMARALVAMYRTARCEWQDKTATLKGYGAAARDESLLRYWGLLQEDERTREDGGHAGWWRVTPRGELFIRSRINVPKYAHVYDGKLYRLEGPDVSIHDCLGHKFNLHDLLNGE